MTFKKIEVIWSAVLAVVSAVFESLIPGKNILLLNHPLLLFKQYFYQTRSKIKLGKSTK